MATLTINGQSHDVDVESDTPLLWVLRDALGMMGTKFGCGVAECGACTVHVDGVPVRSCVLPLSAVAGSAITTIEGLPSTVCCTACSRRGWTTTFPNAAIAKAG